VTGQPPPRAPALAFLTATVTPPAGVPGLSRSDPAIRLGDYEQALRFYLGLPRSAVDRVVLADNSASDLGSLEALAAGADKEVELLSFDGLDYPVAYGRAYGETRLVETALGRSRLLRGLGPDEPFWKLTGRLRFTNLPRLAATAPERFDLYADFRRFPRRWVDMRVLACTPAAFRALIASRVELLREDRLRELGLSSPEERLFDELLAEQARWGIFPRFKTEPRIEGHSGFDGADYGRFGRRAWTGARAALRRAMPGLWV
jgi:hypothetical protein